MILERSCCFKKLLSRFRAISPPELVVWLGIAFGTPFAGGTHVAGSAVVVAKIFGVTSMLGLKNEQSVAANCAGSFQLLKRTESTRLTVSLMCQVTPRSAKAATWRPPIGPVSAKLDRFALGVKPEKFC